MQLVGAPYVWITVSMQHGSAHVYQDVWPRDALIYWPADFLHFGRLVIGQYLHVEGILSTDLTYLCKPLKVNRSLKWQRVDWYTGPRLQLTTVSTQQLLYLSRKLLNIASFLLYLATFQKKKKASAKIGISRISDFLKIDKENCNFEQQSNSFFS